MIISVALATVSAIAAFSMQWASACWNAIDAREAEEGPVRLISAPFVLVAIATAWILTGIIIPSASALRFPLDGSPYTWIIQLVVAILLGDAFLIVIALPQYFGSSLFSWNFHWNAVLFWTLSGVACILAITGAQEWSSGIMVASFGFIANWLVDAYRQAIRVCDLAVAGVPQAADRQMAVQRRDRAIGGFYWLGGAVLVGALMNYLIVALTPAATEGQVSVSEPLVLIAVGLQLAAGGFATWGKTIGLWVSIVLQIIGASFMLLFVAATVTHSIIPAALAFFVVLLYLLCESFYFNARFLRRLTGGFRTGWLAMFGIAFGSALWAIALVLGLKSSVTLLGNGGWPLLPTFAAMFFVGLVQRRSVLALLGEDAKKLTPNSLGFNLGHDWAVQTVVIAASLALTTSNVRQSLDNWLLVYAACFAVFCGGFGIVHAARLHGRRGSEWGFAVKSLTWADLRQFSTALNIRMFSLIAAGWFTLGIAAFLLSPA